MDPTSQFLEKGILGAIIVVLFGVAVFLYKENKTLSSLYRELAEKRVDDLVKLKDQNYANLQSMKEAYFSSLQGLKDIQESTLNIVMALKEKIK